VIVVIGDADAEAVGLIDPADPLSSALAGRGNTVADIVVGADDDADQLALALDAVVAASGPIGGVVLASAGAAAMESGALAELDPDQWRSRVELPLQRTVRCFQVVHRQLRPTGGGLLVLVPTLALVGAARFAPWAAVAEGQRSLAKSAARVWGADDVTVNCLAVPATLLNPALAGEGPDGGPDRPGQPAPALPPAPGWDAVAPVVESLLSPGWVGVTGSTIAVDGGVWMTP
jgi:NAD(P)-dependent dehydrogenase (short-subunit alcohol dehydrogenase family)